MVAIQYIYSMETARIKDHLGLLETTSEATPGNEALAADYREMLAEISAATARATKAETQAAALQGELAEQESEKLELVQANMGLGELLADVLHDLREAWGESDWTNIQYLIKHLESKAGPAAPLPSSPDAAGPGAHLYGLDLQLLSLDKKYWRFIPGEQKPQAALGELVIPDNLIKATGWNIYSGPVPASWFRAAATTTGEGKSDE